MALDEKGQRLKHAKLETELRYLEDLYTFAVKEQLLPAPSTGLRASRNSVHPKPDRQPVGKSGADTFPCALHAGLPWIRIEDQRGIYFREYEVVDQGQGYYRLPMSKFRADPLPVRSKQRWL
ncbi:hypothetical protein KFL_001860130 [Klebsormidium nitens]|uniref:Uncharacterized protein n=1 Tax=Klebsormidium nitens TaxID=105231 RepID=A0A1Y1I6M0_KLENI|nr:hypothetical protein KFL_001860130 [Klebsormidium nitens]|eukprot:GAQ84366.1 hypothetical protein KFL_001860130 [Klebsormidium nitens]